MKVDLTVLKPRGCTKTSIEWCDFSTNPIRAVHRETEEVGWWCRKYGPDCLNCYAADINKRFGLKDGIDYKAGDAGKIRWVLDEGVLLRLRTMKPRGPFRLTDRPVFFVGDMLDVYYGDGKDERACTAKRQPFQPISFEMVNEIAKVFSTRQDFIGMFLTKRAGRMGHFLRWLSNEWWIPGNTLWGVSAGNQEMANERFDQLIDVPGRLFLSIEPLIGPVVLPDWLLRKVELVIVGGESGPKARPMHPAWARSLRDQCVAAGVPYFFKQWGKWEPVSAVPDGYHRHIHDWGDGEIAYPSGKHKAGRLLDGRQWNQYPQTQEVM